MLTEQLLWKLILKTIEADFIHAALWTRINYTEFYILALNTVAFLYLNSNVLFNMKQQRQKGV